MRYTPEHASLIMATAFSRQLNVATKVGQRSEQRGRRNAFDICMYLWKQRDDAREELKEVREDLAMTLITLESFEDELVSNEYLDTFKLPDIDVSPTLDIPIHSIGLSSRAENCLTYQMDIHSVRELVRCTPKELLAIRNFGQRCLQEVKEALAELDLYLATETKACTKTNPRTGS